MVPTVVLKTTGSENYGLALGILTIDISDLARVRSQFPMDSRGNGRAHAASENYGLAL